jgi:hypothetical protein
LIVVAPASIEFSIISFKAPEGDKTTSPAAKIINSKKIIFSPILLIVDSSSFLIDGQLSSASCYSLISSS